MARARTIKPGFFENETLAALDPLARILFAGLWCIADREGRLLDRPKRIKAKLLPYDDCDCDALLASLAEHGFIARYTVGDVAAIQIAKFKEHQRPHPKEGCDEIPAPPKNVAAKPCNFTAKPDFETAGCALPSSPSFPSSNPTPKDPPAPQGGGEERLSAGEFLSAWNAQPQFTHAKKMTGERLKKFRARVRDEDWLGSWREAVGRAARSPFCCGAGPRGWRATVNWFLRPDTVTRILEGEFDPRAGPATSAHGQPAMGLADRLRARKEAENGRI